MRIITLTTDFGTDDWFVGTMKGVIANMNPRATVVDITHAIRSGNIRAGAFALAASYKYFPKGTVHVVIVDPGVGSKRRGIAVQTERYAFVAPDNGVASFALRGEKIKSVRILENETYFLKLVGQTFHGRDVFAPVAAHLARGVPIAKLGPAVRNFVRLDWPEPKVLSKSVEGEVIYIDRFGNAITNIPAGIVERLGGGRVDIFKGRKGVCAIGTHYQSVPEGQAVAVPGSSGYLEIAVNGGNASARLGLRAGDRITSRSVAERVRGGTRGR
jgi:S-adenosylmethionine hydrolase